MIFAIASFVKSDTSPLVDEPLTNNSTESKSEIDGQTPQMPESNKTITVTSDSNETKDSSETKTSKDTKDSSESDINIRWATDKIPQRTLGNNTLIWRQLLTFNFRGFYGGYDFYSNYLALCSKLSMDIASQT